MSEQEALQKESVMPLRECFFSFKGMQHRPLSVTTEFMESDFDEDDILSEDSDVEDGSNSPRGSINSVGQPSFTTVSSYDEVLTAGSCRMSMELPLPLDLSKPVAGPHGPHLFRSDKLSVDFEDALSLSPISLEAPASFHHQQLVQEQEHQDQNKYYSHAFTSSPLTREQWPRPERSLFRFAEEELQMETLMSWSPGMVAQRMLNADIEPEVCECFVQNDITGSILLKLNFGDLKELGILPFGDRAKVWTQIINLKNTKAAEQSADTSNQDEPAREVRHGLLRKKHFSGNYHGNDVKSNSVDDEKPLPQYTIARRTKSTQNGTDVVMPNESVSIVGIEQMIPKPHQCSKGSNCSKWRRNQRIMEAFKEDYPFVDTDKDGLFIVAGSPDMHKPAHTLRPDGEVVRHMLDVIPSIVASSDVMGPANMVPSFPLEEEALRAVQSRDAQDNVRQFLKFQHQQIASSGEVPPTPPFELFPNRSRQPHGGLRTLPKLAIPSQLRQTHAVNDNGTCRMQQQQTHSQGEHIPITSKAYPLSSETASAAPTSVTSYTNTAIEESPNLTPSLPYRFGTPFSDVDVPVAAISTGPIARNISQSVPPNMNYRAPLTVLGLRSSARRPSFPILPALDENVATAANLFGSTDLPRAASAMAYRPLHSSVSPKSTARAARAAFGDAASARSPQPPPRAKYSWSAERIVFEKGIAPLSLITNTFSSSSSSSSVPAVNGPSTSVPKADAPTALTPIENGNPGTDITYHGDVKKRKTRMLRHEWTNRYVSLKGTRMAVHKDKASMQHTTLEFIDIDDYAISCSTMAASTSKLNAAFKAMNIRRGNSDSMQDSKHDVAAFAFQLIPQDFKCGVRLKKRDMPTPADADGSDLSSSLSIKSGSSSSLPLSAAPYLAGAVNATGKTHYFAVKSRDDRIEWMRKLMLAKAMRQKGAGFEVSVNGNMI
ncbi:hypothetical protein SEPCBS57363_002471 [Sporothrix epigloea]|uniref:Sam and ph domain containing protein n=1 Tax=Sporothrix epigloea TaxID=1892477 RepID=A0ABP0DG99_9PEZI